MNFIRCPRCGVRGFERFSMYSICHDCNYFEVKNNKQMSEAKMKRRKTDYKTPHPFRDADDPAQNQFSDQDHQVVRKALLSIPEREQRVVFLYFWKDQKKQEIAGKLSMTGEQVDKILCSAYERLKDLCLRDSRFSRGFRAFEEVA